MSTVENAGRRRRGAAGPRGAWVAALLATFACGGHDPEIRQADGAAGAGGAAAGGASGVSFCEVLEVLERKCQRCHRDPPLNGAPFPLLSYDDTQRSVFAGSELLIYEQMGIVVENEIMPPVGLPVEPPVEPLTAAERETLLDWVEGGGRGDPECEGAAGSLGAGGAGS